MKEEGPGDVSQPPQEKEKPTVSVSVMADSPATPATPSGGDQKEAEQEERGEVEETPVRLARTARKTPQRSRHRKTTAIINLLSKCCLFIIQGLVRERRKMMGLRWRAQTQRKRFHHQPRPQPYQVHHPLSRKKINKLA